MPAHKLKSELRKSLPLYSMRISLEALRVARHISKDLPEHPCPCPQAGSAAHTLRVALAELLIRRGFNKDYVKSIT